MVVSGPAHVPCKNNLGLDLPNMTFWTDVDLGPAVGTPTAAVRTREGAASYIEISITFWRPIYAPNWFVGWFHMNPLTRNGQSIPMSPMSFQAVIPPGGTHTQTFTIGPLPSTVSWRHALEFSWTADWYSSGYFSQPLFLVYDWPVYPQTRPWLGVLDDACAWAEGESAAGDVARELTLGLFFARRFAYPDSTGSYWTDEEDPTVFRLSNFLATTGYQSGNCVDVSDYLTICQNSQGLGFLVQQFAGEPLWSDYTFTSNLLCPIGSDPTQFWTYERFHWTWHQLAFSPSSTVYDVCAAHWTDLSGNGFANPPFNWPWTGLWQTIGGGGQRYGVVDAPAPNAPCPSSDLLGLTGPYVPNVR